MEYGLGDYSEEEVEICCERGRLAIEFGQGDR